MIPQAMDAYLKAHIPAAVFDSRVVRENGMCFLELGYLDELLLARMGINRDSLGPRLVACMWNEATEDQIGGYLVVDNLAMGSPSMGGIRMLPEITPTDIHNLARGMTLKNAAANLPYGGGKSGIVADPEADAKKHTRTVREFARLIRRYRDIYVPGPDVGTNDADMKTIAVENGIDSAVSKTADMGGNRIDELGAAAGGVIIALERLLEILPRLTVLPQFGQLKVPAAEDLTVLIQGFGAVGAHASRFLAERLPAARVVGVSDVDGFLFDPAGLPTGELFEMAVKHKGLVTRRFYEEKIAPQGRRHPTKFSTNGDNLLRESAFCFVPAAAVFNYLGVLPTEKCAMSVERMGDWSVIVEGANTYSPDPNRKAARTRMEQVVYRQKGVMIANDYLVNSGGVIYAAQEHLIPTPDHLQIPEKFLGRSKKVNDWLEERRAEFAELSEKRREAGIAFREEVIRRNMTELVDLLASDADLLPSKAAEQISLQRLADRESRRTAESIMEPMPTVGLKVGLQEAAGLIVKSRCNIVGVLDADKKLAGVVTTWDITRAAAEGVSEESVEAIMTRQVVAAEPDFSILEIVRELEHHRISAMPVVSEGRVLGMVTSDLLAQRYLLQLLRDRES